MKAALLKSAVGLMGLTLLGSALAVTSRAARGQEGFPAAGKSLSDTEIKEICQSDITLYEFRVKALARRLWNPPRPPSKGVWNIGLAYRVMSDGSIVNLENRSPSSHLPLDESALRAVRGLNGPAQKELAENFPTCNSLGYVDIIHDFVLTDF